MIDWPVFAGMSVSPALAPLTVGRFWHDGARHVLPASSLEMERAHDFVLRTLSGFHFRTGGTVIIASLLDEVAQYMPVERAAMSYGLVVCSIDAMASDGARMEAAVRRFKPAAVFGLEASLLDSLVALGHDPDAVFRDTVVWCRPDAISRLDVPRKRLIAEVGPALALGCIHGEGMHIDRFEWQVEFDKDGALLLSSLSPRVLNLTSFRTNLTGHLLPGACPCGNSDPRFVCD